ncbi:TerB family tellurite resistance protein [Aestuariibacter halophilus]|uniref:TerB family tellurite resistance protein n=1 Tax=Fluctibacter halophilus TaxID=226011 RepID=A0ABS8G8U5_9ALTE|nr:TerB family tellurite resistance protein [Aestuariibacter halophilus]MCC2616119.1 TerB family tellurite resistance protein [Aestuariibacter halophilus]
MFKQLADWFQQQLSDTSEHNKGHSVDVATACLLFEILRADDEQHEQEWSVCRQRLQQHTALAADELETLISMAQKEAAHAADFVQFTRVINQHCDGDQKRAILESLWHIAYADAHLAPLEEHLIRKIADLLYVPHSAYIQSKLAAKP